MMRVLLFFLLVSSSFLGYSQQYDFRIEKPIVKVSISPNYQFLFNTARHPISFAVENDTTGRYHIELAGGEIDVTDSGTFITPLVTGEVLLNIVDTQGNVISSKPYVVKPAPYTLISGARTDTVLSDFVIVSNRIYAACVGFRPFRVKGFTLSWNGFSRRVEGDKIPGPLRIKLFEQKNMTLVTYSEIKVEVFKDVFVYLKPHNVSMLKTQTRDVTRIQID